MNIYAGDSGRSTVPVGPLVSVVIATNRGGPFLVEALDSVLAQSYPRIEIVVVDDGAEDAATLAAIIGGYPSVRLIRQANAGPSVARNNGAARTSGEILVFLDDDDRWHPQRIALQVESLERQPAAVVSYCAMQIIDVAGDVLVPADQRQVLDVHEILRRRTGIMLPNLMVRREAFWRVGGFHPALRLAEDLDLVLKLALEGEFVFVPETGTDYRFHGANSTARHHDLCRSIDGIVRLHRLAARETGRWDLVADHNVSLQANRRFAAWSSARSARNLLANRHFARVGAEALWLARFAPTAPFDWLAGRRSKD